VILYQLRSHVMVYVHLTLL